MFLGTTPAHTAYFAGQEIRRLKPKRFIEPCAGNFSLCQVAAQAAPECKIVCGDVSGYSVAIGLALANMNHPDLKLRPCHHEEWPEFACLNDPLEIAAAVIVWQELAPALAKRHIRYYNTIVRDVKANAKAYLEKNTKKLRDIRDGLGGRFSFVSQDACVTMREVGPGDLVWFDPPYFLKGYEKMFSALEEAWEFPVVPFTEIDEQKRDQLLLEAHDRGAMVFCRPFEQLQLPPFPLVYQYEYKAGAHIWVHSNASEAKSLGRVVTMPERDPKWDTLAPGDRLDPKANAKLVAIDGKAANHYRLMWTKKAPMKNMGDPYAVVVGEKLVGIIQLSSGVNFGMDYALLVADCAPTYSDYRRLSKLVLYLTLTQETMEAYSKATMWEHNGVTTKAYTDAAVSMKYRDLFELVERKSPSPSGHKYALTYRTKTLPWPTWKAAYRAWHQKHGNDLHKESA